MLPEKTQYLIFQYLQKIEYDANHELKHLERLNLYSSLGLSRISSSNPHKGKNYDKQKYEDYLRIQLQNLTFGDEVIGWLSIVSAKSILPVWGRIWEQTSVKSSDIVQPQDVLEVAEKFLLKKLTYDDLIDFYCDFNVALNIQHCVTFDVASSFKAAYCALEMIMYGLEFVYSTIHPNKETYNSQADFAAVAEEAYSSRDPNPPGQWEWSNRDALPIEFDVSKRFEFWKWWLAEAIPQAWELAEQSFKTNNP